jgi:hypothetical protein
MDGKNSWRVQVHHEDIERPYQQSQSGIVDLVVRSVEGALSLTGSSIISIASTAEGPVSQTNGVLVVGRTVEGRSDNSNGVQVIGSTSDVPASNGNGGVQIILGRIEGANQNSQNGLQIVTGIVDGPNSSGGWQKVNGQVISTGGSQQEFDSLKNKYSRAIQDLEDAMNQDSTSSEEKDLMNGALQLLQSGLSEINNF